MLYQAARGVYAPHEALKLFAFTLQYAIAFVLFGRIQFLYSHEHYLLQIRGTAAIIRVSSYSLLLLSAWVMFSKMTIPRLLLLLSWALITTFLLVQKHATRRVFAAWKRKHIHDRRALILGCGSDARRLFSLLLNSPDLQIQPVSFFEEQPSGDPRVIYSHGYRFRDHAPVYSGKLDEGLLRRLSISDIFVADPNLSSKRIQELEELSSKCGAELSFVGPTHLQFAGRAVYLRAIDGLFVTAFGPSSSTAYKIGKRTLDVILSTLLIILCLPLWTVLAVWIKLSSPGPVFFKQERIGLGGKPFPMYKFRSMYITARKYDRSPENPLDPRITPAGRFLRKSSLDELPQLLNVFAGHMSLVGPRPEMPYIVEQYSAHQAQRLTVPQGITGLWQLSADRKYAIHQSIEYDLYYIQNRDFFMDLAILLHTVFFAARGT